MSENWPFVHVIKEGAHTDSQGIDVNFSPAMLEQIASDYNTAIHEAPAIPGHVEDGKDAAAWVKRLEVRRNGHVDLWAELGDVDPKFEQLLRAGRFKKVSAALWMKFKETGRPYFRHLAFLGAQVPAIKGLKPIKFTDGDFIAIETEETMSEKKPDTPATGVQLSEEQVGVLTRFYEGIKSLFKTESAPAVPAEFAEKVKKMDELNQQLQSKVKEMEVHLAEGSKQTASAQVTAFAERMTAKKVAPAVAGRARLIAEALLNGASVLTFTEKAKDAEGKEVETEKEVPLFQAFCELIEANAAIVPTTELGGTGGPAFADLPQVNATRGKDVVGIEHLRRVKSVQAEAAKGGKPLSFAEASALVASQATGDEKQPGSMTAGQA